MSSILLLFAKVPLAGQSKTRLAADPTIGPELAARLSEAFLRDTLAWCVAAEFVRTRILFAPDSAREWFLELVAGSATAGRIEIAAQAPGALGARLMRAFADAFADGASRTVVVGSDAPHVGPACVATALRALDDHDLVVGPSEDGGYYLLAARRRCDGLFESIEWSSPRVLTQTLERARAAGLSVARLASSFDVDDVEDLWRLEASLRTLPAEVCPHSRAVLRSRST